MIRRTPNRATSSNPSLSSRPEPNNASISPRIFSVGDTRDGTGVVLPVQTLAVLYGTYARRHLHRWMDTAASHPPLCQAITSHARQRRRPAPAPSPKSRSAHSAGSLIISGPLIWHRLVPPSAAEETTSILLWWSASGV